MLIIQAPANAQIVIGTPNLGFSQACASDSFNTYNATFIFSPEAALNASNQFTIEMSDADGDFSNPTIVYTSPVRSSNYFTCNLRIFQYQKPQLVKIIEFELKVLHLLQQVLNQYHLRLIIKFKIHLLPLII